MAAEVKESRKQRRNRGGVVVHDVIRSFKGTLRADKRTKDMIKRLREGDIALIDHSDVDRVCAEGLIRAKIAVVLNADRTISGRYPNPGPALLLDAGIHIVDALGADAFASLHEGETVTVTGNEVYAGEKLVARGEVLGRPELAEALAAAGENLASELEAFAKNTLEYIQADSSSLLQLLEVPDVKTKLDGRHALIVVRGHHYQQDLRALMPYIRDTRPALIAVDGGADALIERGLKPDIIVGDMDSVSDSALRSGAELIVHGYADGRAPGSARLDQLGLEHKVFPAPATSEDIAMILAYEHGAQLIVAVGTHMNLIDFLDKGRHGMASTFLTRLKVGTRFIDAKGVSEMYRTHVPATHLFGLMAAGLVTISLIILLTPGIKSLVFLMALRLRVALGF